MMRFHSFGKASVAFICLFIAGCSSSQNAVSITQLPVQPENMIREEVIESDDELTDHDPAPVDRVAIGRFDGGKMWTFDNPPTDYFKESYKFSPDSAWFAKARLGALRFSTFCSASFVSSTGLVMTNHHCARSSVTDVSESGESLLDDGFYANSMADERKVDDLYVEQLIEITDITQRIYNAVLEVPGSIPQAETRRLRAESIEKRMQSDASARDSSLHVDVIALYNGGKYAAYTFKRFEDIRLVMAPELQTGFFSGDYDNFTFPRYNLDVSFFRAYDRDGNALRTPDYYRWSQNGARDGDAVFVVGNPGSTSRLSTVAQLNYFRDYSVPQNIRVYQNRSVILAEYIASNPEAADSFDVRNDYFSIKNSLKSETGQLGGLTEGSLIARRGSAELAMAQELAESDSLSDLYGSVLGDIERIQVAKRVTVAKASAFTHFTNPSLSSRILTRAMYGYIYELLKQRGAPPTTLKDIRSDALKIKNWPRELERDVIEQRLGEFEEFLGSADPTIKSLFRNATAEALADSIAMYSALADSASFRALLDENYLASGDVTVEFINGIAPLYFTLDQQLRDLITREETFAARLARARFAVYGESMPPDASFSLRIADGLIKGYSYNGTLAPAFTTFYGLYDQALSHAGRDEWKLSESWENPGPGFDFDTPFNLVSTNDIAGGNSGSPLLNIDLEIVGLVFDGNMESLPNQYLYTDRGARTISVDARAILEALDEIYDADRIVLEIKTGRLFETEEEADAANLH